MSRRLFFGVVASLTGFLAPSLATTPALAADVGVSVSIGQPGFYGRIDIGSLPPPPLIYPQPVVILPAPIAVVQEPIYLRVPPGHAQNWSRHCRHYNACGQRTYFVQDHWYQTEYAPRYHAQHHDVRRHDVHSHGHRGDRHRDDRHPHRGHHKGKGRD